ncbi:MAG TPA: hypothetical protein IAB44_07535 [Candidatus Limivivens intestinipullorum]|uniref:Lipoprotein n=1 Tax=Candidatus Limivivens intestinipullorum TaxID=2840858 RepID=A0A9D1JJR7_9FIRM|nr:hypothetical protein [Candidatus Limivivens intestinipullorum]
MKLKKILCILGLAGLLTAAGGCAGNTKEEQQIRETDTLTETEPASDTETETETEPASDTEEETADAPLEGAVSEVPVRIYGTIQEIGEDTITVDNQSGNSSSGEIILNIDPESTYLVDGQTGLPAVLADVEDGYFEAYLGPVMTLSLPPHTTPEVVIVNLSQEDTVPQYVVAAKDAVTENGTAVLEGTDGSTWEIPESADIQPFRTRNIVTTEDITEGRGCLIWQNEQKEVTKVVLFES